MKRLLRSSEGKLGNEELFLEAGTSPGLALLGTGMQGLGEGTESYTSKEERGADGWALFGKGQRMKLHRHV